MGIEIVDRQAFQICGYGIECTLQTWGYNAVRNPLFDKYRQADRAQAVEAVAAPGSGLYAAAWFISRNGDIMYMAGRELAPGQAAPEGALVRDVAADKWAVASFPADADIEKAWNEHYYHAGTTLGYAPNYGQDVWFEYYPEGIGGPYELWIAVAPVEE
ncbi:MAG: GyrI-like domain-containing protein [Propionibacteriaceae bacterium]|jgi:predicted transcriptional regulator YdeE|nr:GyrI-like domain-containing protein [Propionibacteriaceae bacterium]